MVTTRNEHSYVVALRDAPGGRDVLPIVAATVPPEADPLAAIGLTGLARPARHRYCCFLARRARHGLATTRELATAPTRGNRDEPPGAGDEALLAAPDLLAAEGIPLPRQRSTPHLTADTAQ